MRKLYLFSGSFLASLALVLLTSAPSLALSGAGWDAGRIIDDGKFTDDRSMSVSEIQNFLEDMLDDSDQIPDGIKGSCDTDGEEPYGGTTKAAYGAANGNPAPFTCLPEYYENPSNGANNYGGAPIPSGAISAAEIIKNAAVQYDINPQALIVMLQKEQGLVTDDWAWEIQYEFAMGYGCFDNGSGCSQTSHYPGFFQQVDAAAWQLRQYMENPQNYNFDVGTNYILWNVPSTNCGGGNVTIENSATAALYNYTPYQPNAAALNNLYGTGDGCSAYGNRNFWRYFNDWFGPTTTNYSSSDYFRYKHEKVFRGETVTAELWFKNTGGNEWYDKIGLATAPPGTREVRLYTSRGVGRNSIFSSGWPSSNVAALNFTEVYESDGKTLAADQHKVEPGQIAKYIVSFKVPSTAAYGRHREYFQPSVFQKPGWFNDPGSFIDITVQEKIYRASDYHRYKHQDAFRGQTVNGRVYFKNTGTVPWYDKIGLASAPAGTKEVRLYTSRGVGRNSIFSENWHSSNVVSTTFTKVYKSDGKTLAANQHVAKPGEIVRWNIPFTVPKNATFRKYREYFQPSVFQNPGAFNDPGSFLDINVRKKVYRSSDYFRFKHQDAKRGETVTAEAWFKNTGDKIWYDQTGATGSKTKTMLYTSHRLGHSSILGSLWGPGKNVPGRDFTEVYESDGKTLAANQHKVEPGQIAKYEISFKVPSNAPYGRIRTFFQPSLFKQTSAFNDPWSFLDVTVVP
ncbi:MAG: hypothetical protein R3313_01155 [Candidatus Saccharimonadales bacterium]|nr:hypothetical protein [Candidatus Saccharimonadales bacterium]